MVGEDYGVMQSRIQLVGGATILIRRKLLFAVLMPILTQTEKNSNLLFE